jgi:transglycosylase-like protein with SLT domain
MPVKERLVSDVTAKTPQTPSGSQVPAARITAKLKALPKDSTGPSPVVIPADPALKRAWGKAHAPIGVGPISVPRRTMLMLAVVAILAAGLLAAQPLLASANGAPQLRTFAGLLPWSAPTATAYVPPHSSDPGKQAIIDEIVAVFGSYAPGALNVARCESDYDPNSRNTIAIGNSHAMGVFQILYPSTWNGTSYASSSPYDPHANIRAAYEIFKRDGYSWREWQCKP